MNTIDLIIFAIVGSSVISGAIAGLARSGIGLISAIAGLIFSFWFYQVPSAFVQAFISSKWMADIIGFFIVFVPFLVIGTLVGKLFSRLFHSSGLSWIDHMAGAAFGLVRGAFVAVAFVAILLAFAPQPMPDFIGNSTSLPYVLGASHLLSELAPQEMKDAFSSRVDEVKDLLANQVEKGRQELDSMRASSPDKSEKKR